MPQGRPGLCNLELGEFFSKRSSLFGTMADADRGTRNGVIAIVLDCIKV